MNDRQLYNVHATIAKRKERKAAIAKRKEFNASRKSLRIELDPDLFNQLKDDAKSRKVTVNSIVSRIIKEYLSNNNT